MTIIVQISDTHFGTEQPHIVAAAIAAITRLAPDIVILTGDITQRARHGQFIAAQRFVAALPAAVKLAIPGNHDLPLFNLLARCFWPYGAYARAFGARNFDYRQDGFGIVGFDATSPLRHKDGKLNLEHADRRLAAMRTDMAAEARLIVAVHQPLATAWAKDAGQTLIGRDETAALFARHRVDLVLSGHVHVPMIATSRDRFPQLRRHFIMSNAGTAVSGRTRDGVPNSFNVIRLGPSPAALEIEQYDNAAVAGFRQVGRVSFKPGTDGWIRAPGLGTSSLASPHPPA